MPDMTQGSLTSAAVRRTDKENCKANTKARAHQARANHLAGAT